MLKFYKSMTLLNTMDRILYESQRQVCGDGLGRGLRITGDPPTCVWAESSQGGERVEWRAFVLGSLEFLGFSWGSEGECGKGLAQGQKDGPDH